MSEDNPSAFETDIPLAETLRTLRRELQTAQLESAGEGILFRMDKAELELKVIVTRKSKGHGGIEFYVVKAGGEIERSGETTHTIKLTLTPVSGASGEPVNVSGQGDAPSRG
jgi:hypothetical protein